MRLLRQVLALSTIAAAAVLLSACSERRIQGPSVDADDGSDPGSGPEPLVAASWSGLAGPIELTMTLDTVYIDGSVVGSGVLGSVHAAFAFDMDGEIAGSVITLDFAIPAEGTVTFEGTATTDNRIVGVLNGLGFDQFGISLEPVTEDGGDEQAEFDPSQPQPGVSPAFAGEYEGDWTVFIFASRLEPDGTKVEDSAQGSCSGSVTLTTQTLLDRLFGRPFGGSYLVLDDGACLNQGITVSGSLKDGRLRPDGGFNVGLEIPGSDGNFFEDVLAGSGIRLDPSLFVLLGCSIINKDLENQMDGSIIGGRMSSIASASLDCPGLRGGIVNMSVAMDATKSD